MASAVDYAEKFLKLKNDNIISDDEFFQIKKIIINDFEKLCPEIECLYDSCILYESKKLTEEEFCALKTKSFEKFSTSKLDHSDHDEKNNISRDSDIDELIFRRKKEVNSTITSFSFIAALIGLFPLPIADAPLLIITQFFMMRNLCHKYERKIGFGLMLIILSAFLGPIFFSAFAKLLPGLGSIIGACIAGSFTYLVGKTSSIVLDKGQDFTGENMKVAFLSIFESKN